MNAARRFYDATLGALGHAAGELRGRWLIYASPTVTFAVTIPIDGKPATHANGGTIGFAAATPDQVEAWHAAGLAADGTSCEAPPGLRDNDGAPAYIAYLRDPCGNKLCAKCEIR
jgi:hypothetical protein